MTIVPSSADYDPTTGVVTVKIQVLNKVVRPFANGSPFNLMLISKATTWFDTPSLHCQWWAQAVMSETFAKDTDPVWTAKLPDFIAPDFHRNRSATMLSWKAPAYLAVPNDSDHVLHIVQPNGDYLETWDSSIDSTNRVITARGWARGNRITGKGVGDNSNNAGVRAANFSWAAGLITGSDIATGRIDHALAVALPRAALMDNKGTASYIAPATAWDNGSGADGPIKMGSLIGIPASVNRPAGLSPLGIMVFDALQRYGAYVGDYFGGDQMCFYADAGTVPDQSLWPLYASWDSSAAPDGRADGVDIGPLLRVANYQP